MIFWGVPVGIWIILLMMLFFTLFVFLLIYFGRNAEIKDRK